MFLAMFRINPVEIQVPDWIIDGIIAVLILAILGLELIKRSLEE